MLEILLVVWLGRKLAALARSKGRSPTGYVFMLIGLWIAGEVIGMIIGAMIASGTAGEFNFVAYLFALVGAAVGAIGSFLIVRSLPSIGPGGPQGFPVTTAAGMPYQPPGSMPPPPPAR
ncbi:hypothetical protein BH09PLA1_BH09PLA1_33280 [soil metagenome]